MPAVRPKPIESEETALADAAPPHTQVEQRLADLERAVADLRSELDERSVQMRTLLALVAVFTALSRR